MNGKIFSVRIKFFMIYDISYLFSLSNFPHTHIISNQMIMHNMDYMPYPLYKISLHIIPILYCKYNVLRVCKTLVF